MVAPQSTTMKTSARIAPRDSPARLDARREKPDACATGNDTGLPDSEGRLPDATAPPAQDGGTLEHERK